MSDTGLETFDPTQFGLPPGALGGLGPLPSMGAPDPVPAGVEPPALPPEATPGTLPPEGASTPTDPAVPPSGEGGDPGQGAPPAPSELELPDGTRIPLERIAELAQLESAFRADPQIAQAMRSAYEQTRQARLGIGTVAPVGTPPGQVPGYITGSPGGAPGGVPYPQPQVAPAPGPFTPPPPVAPAFALPEGLDPTDPYAQGLMAVASQQAQTFQLVQLQQQALAAQQAAAATNGIAQAHANLSRRYAALTVDDHSLIENRVAELGIAPGLVRRYGDYTTALTEAFDMVANSIPEIRGRLVANPTSPAADAKRQAALNALASGSGHVSRSEPVQPVKLSDQDLQKALATEIRGMMGISQ